jgi:subtilisin family serine protease
MKQFVRVSLALVLAGGFGLTGIAEAQDQFVLTASTWGAAQEQAVANAGGSVLFSHAGAGVAVVQSSARDFLAKIRKAGAITSAELDRMVRWTPADPETLTIDAQAEQPPPDTFFSTIQWAPQAIGAPDAWALGCTGEGVRVAILDGGIHSAHADLAPNLDVARSVSFVPGQAFNVDTGTFWHGTHVAGIVAAADNGIGTIGIAPNATLVGVKVLHSGTGSFGWVIQGILYAATPIADGGGGADIINMSLGALFPRGGGNTGAGALVAAMNKAVNYANRHGVLVVSAAGNDETDLQHGGSLISVPAESGAGVAVSATGPVGFAYGETNFDRPASYTNYGVSAINVSAPGGDFAYPGNENCSLPRAVPGPNVVAPCWVFDMVMSTVRGGSNASYGWAAGTSMAAPAAAGVAAMIKQMHPDISLGALKTRLQNSAIATEPKAFHGKGWVNALNACQQ